ncbi:MAG: glycosyltransferase [candidate division KSB1 bacterium]|nr:glycosyltransferase [candidate division KSB1 bacterium]
MRVCYYGSYDLSEPHNSTHIEGLKQAGVEVIECNLPAMPKRDAEGNYRNMVRTIGMALALVKTSLMLFGKLCRQKKLDAIIVGYPGFFDLPFAKLYATLKKIPLIFNVHISLYETIVVDRGYFAKQSLVGRLSKWYDRLLFRLSNVVLADTQSHAEYFAKLYNLSPQKFRRVFIGADPMFRPAASKKESSQIIVLFYGTFIPLQGIEHIVRAADLLKHEKELHFEIIGRGQTQAQIVALAKSLDTTNITFIDWMNRADLVARIAQADICLGGQFGLSEKADLVIGYKCFQMIAMGKATVVSDSKGNRELLTHDFDCYMCKPGDPHALAEAILALKNDAWLRRRIAAESYRTFNTHCSLAKIGNDLRAIIEGQLHRAFSQAPAPAPALSFSRQSH